MFVVFLITFDTRIFEFLIQLLQLFHLTMVKFILLVQTAGQYRCIEKRRFLLNLQNVGYLFLNFGYSRYTYNYLVSLIRYL